MKNRMSILVFISLSTVLCNCSSRYTNKSISDDDLLAIAKESLRTTDFETQYNPDSSFVLLSTFEETGYSPSTTFVVVRLTKKPKAIYNSGFRGDYLNWTGISTIMIKEKTGLATPMDNGLKTFEIDVVSGDKKEKNNPNDENKK
ncbi:hypothetical protein [Marinoscillum luteum]|uniref:Lipoprotein n=1 Tax=Marinoscillum luteum TaxID=861051 RepID=A0ABW7NB16_9BACT